MNLALFGSTRKFMLRTLFPSIVVFLFSHWGLRSVCAQDTAPELLKKIQLKQGLLVLLGQPSVPLVLELAAQSEFRICVQFAPGSDAKPLFVAIEKAGLLNQRIAISTNVNPKLNLGSSLADVIFVVPDEKSIWSKEELLRILRPGGKAFLNKEVLVKPLSKGIDSWSHPYHGPDNNPLSTDKLARAPYQTQFLAAPLYGPQPAMTLISGGRMFKAFGSFANRVREWEVMNSLLAMSAFNGEVLWKRKLAEGFMIHRNTMIATPDTVYLADNESCKLLDAATGKLIKELKPLGDGPNKVWKWMAMVDGVLYALLGPEEFKTPVNKGTWTKRHWSWGKIGKGYFMKPFPWAQGQILLAIDPKTVSVLWKLEEKHALDGRAICVANERIYCYAPGQFLKCVDLVKGTEIWKSTDAELLKLIGTDTRANDYPNGYTSSAYLKVGAGALFFAGPQRPNLVAVNVEDGKLLWKFPKDGNFQLVIRENKVYALARTQKKSIIFEALTGKVLGHLARRGNCTRATGNADSIFCRGNHEERCTWRIDLTGEKPRLDTISPYRPACQDGVLTAEGLVYWGPWMCDCNISLAGISGLAAAGDFAFKATVVEQNNLFAAKKAPAADPAFSIKPEDWAAYRGNNARTSLSFARVPASKDISFRWQNQLPPGCIPTAPVVAGGRIFVGGSDGVVRALKGSDGTLVWKAYTEGSLAYPPALGSGMVFAGSADGWVYAWEATTGKEVWRFRAAPVERRIPIYGALRSTWPVTGGVIFHDGSVYAVAGLADYDGLHIYALDAENGKIKWQTHEHSNTGPGLFGHLLLHKGRLYFPGGNTLSPASYDVATGKAVHRKRLSSRGYPHGRDIFLGPRGVRVTGRLLFSKDLDWVKDPIDYYAASKEWAASVSRGRINLFDLGVPSKNRKKRPPPIWSFKSFSGVQGLALCKNAVVVLGEQAKEGEAKAYSTAALSLDKGALLWQQTLEARPVDWGMAIDANGLLIISLINGKIVCLGGVTEDKKE